MARRPKIATATRISGNLYDILYPGCADHDKGVPYAYIKRRLRDGYRVTVDQRACRGEGDPESYEVGPEDA